MASEGVERRAGAIVACIVALVALADVLSSVLGLKALQDTEWPTDLFAYAQLPAPGKVDVGVVGSSRAHFALPPSALDACLSRRLGRPTQTLAANRMRASAYAIDVSAREVFSGARGVRPDVLVVEVAPESVSRNHFEMDASVSANADVRDVPECVAAALRDGTPSLASCARPLVRGVENLAFLLHRPLTDTRHIGWMMTYHGGGQYCFDDEVCLRRNEVYDRESHGRWDTRLATVLPRVRSVRFADWEIGGLPAERFVATLDRARGLGQRALVVNLPVHGRYQREIPPDLYATYLAWVRDTVQAHGASFLDANTTEWQGDRARFLDADHLNSRGAQLLSEQVCAEVAPALH